MWFAFLRTVFLLRSQSKQRNQTIISLMLLRNQTKFKKSIPTKNDEVHKKMEVPTPEDETDNVQEDATMAILKPRITIVYVVYLFSLTISSFKYFSFTHHFVV